MKQFIFVCLVSFVLVSCSNNTRYDEIKLKYVIDSVEYHPIGHDNTLQTSPYWKLHINDGKNKIVSRQPYEKGDSIEVIVRKIK